VRKRKTSSHPRNPDLQEKSRSYIQQAADARRRTPTFGEVFPSGVTIELIKPGANEPLELRLCNGKHATIGPEARFEGSLFYPAKLSRSIQQIVRFPEKSADFESTTKLFTKICHLFASNGFSVEVALAATHFIFASWFADVLPLAPCLLITGPQVDADLLLQLLACGVRRPLPISEFSRRAICSLPMQLRPTLLINTGRMTGASLALLRASNHHRSFFTVRDNLVDVFCAKAVYCAEFPDSRVIDDSTLHIALIPSCGSLPFLEQKYYDEAAREFQSKFLAYRARYIQDVQCLQFDQPTFTSGTRILSRIIGAPIVDAPALQAGQVPLLQEHEAEITALRWTDLQFVVLEAVIHHIHKNPGVKVHVGDITETALGILKGRGDSTKYDPREIGNHLRDFGLRPKRDGQGNAIRLDSAVCRDMHLLARRFGVLAKGERKVQCSYCDEISDAAKSKNEPASGGQKKG
jgi:hypothetical protein